eukprot:Nitzschia sp. Nitz4//scaffold70_size99833//11331//12560//NITZ4_004584-RA/size99833-processed-gene-0.91-mRNA-1//1//CDS//3329557102//8618//frame0
MTTKWTLTVHSTIYSVQQRDIQILDDLASSLPNATSSSTSRAVSIQTTNTGGTLHSPLDPQQPLPLAEQPSSQEQQTSAKRVQRRHHHPHSTRVVVTSNTRWSHPKSIRRQRKPRYGKVLYFLHIHKAGGTFFCNYVLKNHVHASKRNNCNVQPDFYCCGKEDTIEAQIQYAKTTQWDLVATERDMYEHMAVDSYTYIVSLRQSKDRYYSHWGHLKRALKQVKYVGDSSWLFGNITVDQVPKKYHPKLGNFSQWWAGQPDNWNTRILCGPKCRPQPKYQITRDQFEYALQRLTRFSFVLLVEDMQGSYDKIAAHYNWTRYGDIVRGDFLKKNGNQNANKKPPEIPLSLEPWDPSMSALDDALYEFAQRKNRGDEDLWRQFSNQEALDAYFRAGPSEQYTHICGASCTPY